MPAEEYRVVAIRVPSLPRKVDLWQRKGAAVCHFSTFLGGRRPSGSLPLPQVQFPQQPANAGVPSHCHRSAFLGCLPADWVGGVGSPDLFEPLSCLRRSPRARRPGPTPPAATPPSPAACRPQYKDAWRGAVRVPSPGPVTETHRETRRAHGARMGRLGTPVPTWVGATPGAGCLGIPKRERISGWACLGIPRRERVSGEACLGIPGRERILGVPNGARPGRIKHLASKPVHAPARLSTRCAKPMRVPGGLSTGAPSRARTPTGLGTPHQLRPWAPVLGRLRCPMGGAAPIAKHREPEAMRRQARLGIPPLPSRRCQVPSIPRASCTARTTPPSPLAPFTSDATS